MNLNAKSESLNK